MTQSSSILVVDDAEATRDLIAAVLRGDGYSVREAGDGAAALAEIERELPDIVLTDVMMPNLDGFELCRRLKQGRATRLIPVVLVTALAERADRIEGITAGADDFLTKPFDIVELKARVASLTRLKRFTDELDSAESVILRLAVTVEERQPHNRGHCERMAAYAAAFGVLLDLGDDQLAALHRGGYLHDVGKIAVPDAILAKPGPLTAEETDTMRRHTIVGETLCGQLKALAPVKAIARHHHERVDGSGYPDGLQGDAIPLLAQMIGIVDVYEALTTGSVYRTAMTDADACAELAREAERGWRRRDLVTGFVELCNTGRLRKLGSGTPRT